MFLWRLLFVFILVVILGYLTLSLTAPSKNTLPDLQTGDVLLQPAWSSQALAIMLASGSLITHTGFVERSADGTLWVHEANGPVQRVPLMEWIDRGIASRVTILRDANITAAEQQALVAYATKESGKPYDWFFRDDDSELYCSEFIYDAYAVATGTGLGTPQRVGDLALNNFAVQDILRERLGAHPDCAGLTPDACYARVMDQTLITPAALATDDRAQTIYSNLLF